MFRPDEAIHAFRLIRSPQGLRLEGVSIRYTAIALLGLQAEAPEDVRTALHGQSPADVCAGLIERCETSDDLGEVALTLWAAALMGHSQVDRVLARLNSLDPLHGSFPTVETSWALSAMVLLDGAADASRRMAERLMESFDQRSELFPHWPAGARGKAMRAHVTCFADWVYPVQALAAYAAKMCDERAKDVAVRCAARMCGLQGRAGQWWCHYDVRTGQVFERYPVYAIHQDAMAPMTLFDLEDHCGVAHHDAIVKSMQWLASSPEINGSLIDSAEDVIWRKVARREPGKLVRTLQASASRLHSGLRVPGVGKLFPPGAIDFETRPYHMGWLLYAWRGDRASRLGGSI